MMHRRSFFAALGAGVAATALAAASAQAAPLVAVEPGSVATDTIPVAAEPVEMRRHARRRTRRVVRRHRRRARRVVRRARRRS